MEKTHSVDSNYLLDNQLSFSTLCIDEKTFFQKRVSESLDERYLYDLFMN